MKNRLDDTIAALATPVGEGALSVIRVSGSAAIEITARQFQGKINLADADSHTAHYGRIINTDKRAVDEVVCTIFRAPHSYTGENIVEVSCHGGILVTKRVLECLIEAGARPADPGEFTQRAFIHGRIDLSQAEAIADIIQAQSDRARENALDQLKGSLSHRIHHVREQLVQSAGLLELELDFAEENLEFVDKANVEQLIRDGIREITGLLNTYRHGKVLREGVRVALVGVPNAGKSSLLNALLNEDRAIVTDIPGTTRDFIEEKIFVEGILVRLIDTAGLRESADPVEREGVARALKVAENSDIVLLVHDATRPMDQAESDFITGIRKVNAHLRAAIVINNKVDLAQNGRPKFRTPVGDCTVSTSALNKTGIEELKKTIGAIVVENASNDSRESVTITNDRHYSALVIARDRLSSSLESIRNGVSSEFIAGDLRLAIEAVGEIVGAVTTEEILQSIFSRFCIGK